MMSQFNAPTYDIERPTGQCAFSGQTLQPGQPYVATLVEVDPDPQNPKANPSGLKRMDVTLDLWEQGSRPPRLFSFWKSIVPQPNQKKKVFVDDLVLMNLVKRLADADQQQRVAFRFVLALVLMRKKLLRYEGSRTIEAPPLRQPEPPLQTSTPDAHDTPDTPDTADAPATAEATHETSPDAANLETSPSATQQQSEPQQDAQPAAAAPALVKYEAWLMTPKGEDEPLQIINPQLDDAQIQQVTEQLGEILQGEL